jgi:hypothetical protein
VKFELLFKDSSFISDTLILNSGIIFVLYKFKIKEICVREFSLQVIERPLDLQ